jgi:DNA modification methylase
VAAIRLGRRFLGWEMNPQYLEMASKRLANARERLVFDL